MHPINQLWKGLFGCFLKWWYPRNTPKWSFLVGKPWLLGTTILGNPHLDILAYLQHHQQSLLYLGRIVPGPKFHVFVAKVTMESLGEGCVRMGVKKTYIYIYICGSWWCSWLVFQTAMFFSILLFYHFIMIEDMIHRAKTLPSMIIVQGQ